MKTLSLQPTDSFEKRFWSKVEKAGPDDCWMWTASFRNGYGAIKHQNKVHSAHRVAFVLTKGDPPKGKQLICHKCNNSACCNPAHLYAGTHEDNRLDVVKSGTAEPACGEAHPFAVLNESTVASIWTMHRSGMQSPAIAKELNLNRRTVFSVISKRSWKHLIPNWAK